MTRPEPTIYGNCESWDFIVGKKPALNSLEIGKLLILATGSEALKHKVSCGFTGAERSPLYAGSTRLDTKFSKPKRSTKR
jgi:hypothetical protein